MSESEKKRDPLEHKLAAAQAMNWKIWQALTPEKRHELNLEVPTHEMIDAQAEARYESEVERSGVMVRNFITMRQCRDELIRQLQVADDTTSFWKDSYGAEYEAHEETKKNLKHAEERWGYWRERAVKVAQDFAEIARKRRQEAQEAKARRLSKNSIEAIRGWFEPGVVSEVRATQMWESICYAVGAGGLGSESPSNNPSPRRG